MRIIVLTGMPGSGKEEFVQVGISMGYDVVRMGDVVREEAKRLGVINNDKNIGGFAHSERLKYGYDIWAKRTIPHIHHEKTIIDGSRGLDELSVFKEAFKDAVKVVAIHTSPKPRFERLQRRGRADAPNNFEEFEERDKRELSWGIGSLIALADIMLVNESTLECFKRSVRSLLEELSK
ncbi:MAG: AAA family ATPase [Methanomassiliicoccales archaeon]